MFEIRSREDKKPIIVQTIDELETIAFNVFVKFDRTVWVKYPDSEEMFEYTYIGKKEGISYTVNAQMYVDIVILGLDGATSEKQLDYGEIFKPIFEANMKLVEQYKAGNEKALNALLGKFLKDNRDSNPKDVKEALIKLLS